MQPLPTAAESSFRSPRGRSGYACGRATEPPSHQTAVELHLPRCCNRKSAMGAATAHSVAPAFAMRDIQACTVNGFAPPTSRARVTSRQRTSTTSPRPSAYMPQNDARCAAAPSQWPSLFPNDLPHSQMALLIPKWPVLTTHVAACCGLAQLNFFRDVSDPSCRACGFSEAYQVCKKCPFGSSLDASAASVGLDACSCNGGL